MGKKKNSKSKLSATPYDHMEADQESTSTRDSSDLSDPTPPPDSLSASVEYLTKQFAHMATAMQNLTDQVTALDKKLISSTVTQNSSETMEKQLPVIIDKLNINAAATEKTRELFYNFKKDVKDYLGLDTPSRLDGSNFSSTEEDRDIPMSFRHVLEKITNPLDPLPNHHFQTFLSYYTKWQLYRGRGGAISLYGYIQTSPSVYAIYLAKARSQDPSFQFTKVQDNVFFFNQLINFVFFPTGFDISAFEILIKEKRMKQFLLHRPVNMPLMLM